MVQTALRRPRKIGGYRVQVRLGAGGMGEVFRAVSRAGEHVAVKVIRADLLGDLEVRLRFVREVQALKAVTGTRIACLIDADPEAEEPWLATQYVHGPNLLQYVETRGPLPPELVAILGAVLAEGLRSLELAGLLHRDLKPQNIVLGPDGPVVIDFGLAVMAERKQRLTATGIPIGTVACMSPEQALGEKDLTTAADVYGLGATLLFAATGRYPYDAAGYAAMIGKITDRGQRPDLDGVPEALRSPLGEMLRFDPDDRPELKVITDRLVTWLEQDGLSAMTARRRLTEVTTVGVQPLTEPAQGSAPPDSAPRGSVQPDPPAGATQTAGSPAEGSLAEGSLAAAEAVASGVRGQVPPDRQAAAVVADRLGRAYARGKRLRKRTRESGD